jgi:hypothetical protein
MVASGIAVVIPFHNGHATVVEVVGRTLSHAAARGWACHVWVIDDSAMAVRAVELDRLAAHMPSVTVLHNPSNLGQHRSTLTGLRLVPDGWMAVTMDEDLRYMPEPLIDAALALTCDCLYAVEGTAGLRTCFRRLMVRAALRTVTCATPPVTSSYRALNPALVQALATVPDGIGVQIEALIAKQRPTYGMLPLVAGPEMRPSGYSLLKEIGLLWRIVADHGSIRNAFCLR